MWAVFPTSSTVHQCWLPQCWTKSHRLDRPLCGGASRPGRDLSWHNCFEPKWPSGYDILWFMIKWNVLKWTQNHPNWSNLRRSFMANPWFWVKNGSQIVVFLVSFAYRLTTSCLLAAGFPNQGNLPAAKKRSMPSTANSSTPDSVVAPLPGRSIEHFSHIKPCKGLRLAKKIQKRWQPSLANRKLGILSSEPISPSWLTKCCRWEFWRCCTMPPKEKHRSRLL